MSRPAARSAALRLRGASTTSSSAGTEAMLPLNPLVTKRLNACLIDKRLSGGDAPQSALRGGPARLPDHPRAALAEADRRIAVSPAMGAEDDLVAILQICASLAGVQRNRALPGMAELVETSPAFLGRSRDRAASENVTGQQITAAASVMRDELRRGPIQVQRVAARHAVRFERLLAHLPRQQQRFELDVEGARALVVIVPEIA